MSHVLESMLRRDSESDEMHVHFTDGTSTPARFCFKERGDRPKIEDYNLEPLDSVWIGFYDKEDLNEQAGLSVMLTFGKSGEKYGILICRPEKDSKRGWWNYNFIDAGKLRDKIKDYTQNPYTKHYMDLLKVADAPSIVGPFEKTRMNAFLEVCQAYASILRHEHNAETMRIGMPMQLSTASNDLKQALIKFHSVSDKEPIANIADIPDVNLPRLGETSPVRVPT